MFRLDAAARCRVHGAHFSLPVSPIHLGAWGKTRSWVFATLENLAARYRGVFGQLTVGAQDASRAEPGFLRDVALAAREHGLARLRRDCGIQHRQLVPLSRLVALLSGRPLPDAKPVVGAAAFRHESGIHCGGLLQDRRTHEPFAPAEVGHASSTFLVGPHSGTRLLAHELERLGLALPVESLPALLDRVRHFATRRKRALSESEFASLASDLLRRHALPAL